jgi:hypothetical protein
MNSYDGQISTVERGSSPSDTYRNGAEVTTQAAA